jgi:hypothetical protein
MSSRGTGDPNPSVPIANAYENSFFTLCVRYRCEPAGTCLCTLVRPERPGIPAAIGGVLDLDPMAAGPCTAPCGSPANGNFTGKRCFHRMISVRRSNRKEPAGSTCLPCGTVWPSNGRDLEGKGVCHLPAPPLTSPPVRGGWPCSFHTRLPPTDCGSTTGRRVAVGRVGENGPTDMQPSYRTQVAFIDGQDDGEVVLTLQISNFMHAKGGMRAPIQLVSAAHAAGLKHRSHWPWMYWYSAV